MTSMLMNCPQCGVMIPRNGSCDDCHWSDRSEEEAAVDRNVVAEFARRRKLHGRNYAIYMALMFSTGLVGLLTAFMWFRVIYMGSVLAFIMIGVLTVATGVLGVVLSCAKKLFPIELLCPSCGLRLDEVGTAGGYCPGCSTRLQ